MTVPVFEEHQWIEPGETICEKRLVSLQKENWTGLKLELEVYTRKVRWHAIDIIEMVATS